MSRAQYLRLLWEDFDRIRAEYSALRDERRRVKQELATTARNLGAVSRIFRAGRSGQ